MRVVAILLLPAVALGALWHARLGHVTVVRSLPSAGEYSVEDSGDGHGLLRRGWSGRWTIDDYYGERGTLRVVRPPGLGRRFLVLDNSEGNHYSGFRLWDIGSDGSLRLVASFFSATHFTGEDEGSVDVLFQDIDGDGVEELMIVEREQMPTDENVVLWGLRFDYHVWTGRSFVPLYREARVDGPVELVGESMGD